MKFYILLAFACLFSLAGFAQTPGGAASISGSVVDSLKNAPVAYVTISLRETGKTEVLKSTYSQENGSFTFSGLAPKSYELLLSFVGYAPRTIPVTGLSETNLQVKIPAIKLQGGTSQLKEIEISTQKILITQDIDKISYDVEADPESSSNTVLDMLRKVPMVTVDADDNIQLKGNSNYKVLINGKTSALFVRNPKDVLKSMPASSIKKIEVITNPPARYEAEGVGGIINIITNKKNPGGYNGSVNGGIRVPKSYNGGAYLTVKTGKFGFSGSYGSNAWWQPQNINSYIRRETNGSQLSQNGEGKNNGHNKYADAQLSFELDSLNLITGSFSFYDGINDIRSSQNVLLTDALGNPFQKYIRQNQNDDTWNGHDLGIDYQRSFKKSEEQIFTLSYKYNTNGYGTFSDFSNVGELNFPTQIGQTENASDESEHTFQADYVQPFGKNTWEAGLKSISRLNQSTYFYALQNPDNSEFVIDPAQSNDFDYKQDVYAGYASVSLKMKDWGLKAGGRLEQTIIDAKFKSCQTAAEQDYFSKIPSVAISRKLKEGQDAKFSYTQRIERTGLWYLNPYENRIDPLNVSFGNPNLEPTKTHSFDLSHSAFIKTSSLNSSLYYNFTNNAIQSVTELSGDTSLTTYDNTGKEQNLGLSLNTNLNPTNKLNLNLNSNLNYTKVFGTVNGEKASNDGISVSLFGFASYKFEKNWKLSGNVGYNSRMVMLQGRSGGYFHSSFTFGKTFLKNDKATVNLTFNNPSQRTRKWRNEINDPQFYQLQESEFVIRRFGISFTYKFGELKGGIAQKKRGIANDDVKGGKSGGGN